MEKNGMPTPKERAEAHALAVMGEDERQRVMAEAMRRAWALDEQRHLENHIP